MSNIINRMRFIMLFLSFNVIAGNVDLQVEVNIAKSDNLVYGETIPITFTLTNNGPSIAAGTSDDIYPNFIFIKDVFINEFINDREILLTLDDTFRNDCLIFPNLYEPPINQDDPKIYDYIISFRPILKNESVTCEGTLKILFRAPQRNYNIKAIVFGDTDVDPLNNLQKITLRLKPKTIPANSMISLLILFVSVLLVMLFRSRKLKM